MPDTVRVRAEILERMLAEARREPAMECCGLLAGRDGVISAIFPAANALSSATAFEIAPADIFRAFHEMREASLEHLGIYHSHPRGENTPSPRDMERAFYPDAAYFIVSPRRDAVRPIRAFSLRDGGVREISIEPV